MEKVIEFLKNRGYPNVDTSYYSYIKKWIQIWQGNAEWLNVQTVENKKYPMYSLQMGKQVCEDFASIINSEPYDIVASKNDEILQQDLKQAKVMEKLSDNIEIMAFSGTVGTITRIKNASIVTNGDNYILKRNNKTKIKTIDLRANQIIPLTIEDGEIINCAFVSEEKRKINNELVKIYYLEIHELLDKGYQVTNKYLRADNGTEILSNNIIPTYNTLSNIPLFSLARVKRVNNKDNNNGLGMALFGNATDQLMMNDLVYNNFGMDFKLGQKLLIINKKLTRTEIEEYTDKKTGQVKTRQKVIYPSDIRKQQFMSIDDEMMSNGNDKPYIHEFNPNLRVGDNKEGVQFTLDNLSFKCGFGTRYYSFENGVVNTATEAILSNKDLVNNSRKNRSEVNNYLIGICRALLLCEKMLGNTEIDETQDISIKDVDGFLEDDGTKRDKAKEEVSMGLMSKKRYLMEVKNMSEEEALKEIKEIENEDDITEIDMSSE